MTTTSSNASPLIESITFTDQPISSGTQVPSMHGMSVGAATNVRDRPAAVAAPRITSKPPGAPVNESGAPTTRSSKPSSLMSAPNGDERDKACAQPLTPSGGASVSSVVAIDTALVENDLLPTSSVASSAQCHVL